MRLFRQIVILSIVLPIFGCSADKVPYLRLAAAASLEPLLEKELIPLFQEKHHGVEIMAVYDGSGRLRQQIEAGLEADIFIAASEKEPRQLAEAGIIDDGALYELFHNSLVIITQSDRAVPDGGPEVWINNEKFIALGHPDYVPAGYYARMAFERLNIWDKAIGKASLAGNVSEVLQWVAEASAGIGVVYATDAARNRRVKIIYEFPSELFTEPVAYWGVVLNKKPAAEAFMQFIKSAPAAEAAGRYGFKKPDTAHRAD